MPPKKDYAALARQRDLEAAAATGSHPAASAAENATATTSPVPAIANGASREKHTRSDMALLRLQLRLIEAGDDVAAYSDIFLKYSHAPNATSNAMAHAPSDHASAH